MIALTDGRKELYQWDTNVSATVPIDCTQVHFSNSVYGRSLDVDVVGGVAIIPDVLLQTDKDLNAWAFVGKAENGYTKISKVFKVNKRNKPADYVFTPVEQITISQIAEIAQSVRDDADSGMLNGKSAYETWLEQGNTGTQADFLASLEGEKGDKGDKGDKGKSAYEVAVQNGFSGTEEEWLASLKPEINKEEIADMAGAAIEEYLAENPISQAQADWNQTDETAVDYVKNRTHYTEVVLGASTTYITRYYTGNDTMGDKNMSTALVYAFDNVKLTFENEAVLQSNVLTGETRTLVFVIGAGTLTMVATANNGTINVTNNTGISQRVVWEYPSSVEVVVHQIDEKFIPESIARTADVVTTPPAATVGQTIVVSAVDNAGKPTAWEAVDMAESVDIPNSLPNPNKLTFTGAVTAEYDGSEAVSVEIPVGGGSDWKLLGEYEVGTAFADTIKIDLNTFDCNEFWAIGSVPATKDISTTFCLNIGSTSQQMKAGENANPSDVIAYITKINGKCQGFAGYETGWNSSKNAVTLSPSPRSAENSWCTLNLNFYPYVTDSEITATFKLYGR